MTVVQLLLHLGNFVLPALALAMCMPALGQWMVGSAAMPWLRRMGCHAATGLAVLVIGFWVQGQDGTMATYAALVLVSATLEWALQRAGRQ